MTSLTPEDQALQAGLLALAEMLLSEKSAEALLDSVTSLAAESLPGCEAASISLMRNGRAITPVCSAEIAREVDLSQYETGEGPCLNAIKTGDVTRVDSFLLDTRWPEFGRQAAAQGMLSALSLPLTTGDETLGALNLYSTRLDNFGGLEESAAVFARQAAVTLSNAHALRKAEELAQQLAVALENRDVIGQAKGILMAAQGLSSDEAFDLLRRASQRANRKLHDIARELVERRDQRDQRDQSEASAQ